VRLGRCPLRRSFFFYRFLIVGAQVVAAVPRRCRSRRRISLLTCSGKEKILPVCGAELSGWRHLGCCQLQPGGSEPPRQYVHEFRVQTLLGAQPKSHNACMHPTHNFFPMALQDHTQLFQREGSHARRSYKFRFSQQRNLLNPPIV
jgi:hypothetical protein